MSDNECDLPNDEVMEIKRAMREASTRKRTIASKLRVQKKSADTEELESVLKSHSSELTKTKKLLSDSEYQLREAKFENIQLTNTVTKLQDDHRVAEVRYKEKLADLSLLNEKMAEKYDKKNQIVLAECEKVAKFVRTLLNTESQTRNRTSIHLLESCDVALRNLHKFLGNSEMVSLPQEAVLVNGIDKTSSSTAFDGTMLEMCQSLEEENMALHDTVERLHVELEEMKRAAAGNKLIPHYRLAIVRSKSYATNLLEKVKREEDLNQTMREQLEATYSDLKKVVDDNRKLCAKVTKLKNRENQLMEILKQQPALVPPQYLASSSSQFPMQPSSFPVGSCSFAELRRGDHHHDEINRRSLNDPAGAGHWMEDGQPVLLPKPSAVSPHSSFPVSNSRASAWRGGQQDGREEVVSAEMEHAIKADISHLDREIEELRSKLQKSVAVESNKMMEELLRRDDQ